MNLTAWTYVILMKRLQNVFFFFLRQWVRSFLFIVLILECCFIRRLFSHPMNYRLETLQVQEMSSPPRASAVVKDCVKNCIQHTYNFLFANCDEVYKRESQQQTTTTTSSTENNEQYDDGISNFIAPSLKNLQFWHQLMYLLTCIISEDKERYSLVLNQYVFQLYFNLNWCVLFCYCLKISIRSQCRSY